MNALELLNEYNNLSAPRRQKALDNLFNTISMYPERYQDFIIDLLDLASNYEADDYFGTEGLDV